MIVELKAATHVSTVAAGVTWNDVLINWFYDYKVIIAIIAFTVLSAAGVFSLGKSRLTGALLIVASLAVPGVFLVAEKLIVVSKNQIEIEQRPAQGNPFGGRG